MTNIIMNPTQLTTPATGLTIGIDLGDQWSQFCLLDAQGNLVEEGRVKTTPDAFRARFGALAPARIALETGTHSLWASELLRSLGHEVIVAHVREVRAIVGSHRKSDRVDAGKLARYARLDPQILHPIELRSAEHQAHLTLIRARAALVRARTLLINAVRGLVKPLGARLPATDTARFAAVCRSAVPAVVQTSLLPLVEQIERMGEQIHGYDQQIEKLAATSYPEAAPLRSVWGVGPVTTLTFVLTLADPQRFAHSREVGSYLGLCPRQQQSGAWDPQLPISKAGDRYLRGLLVECAHRILGAAGPDSAWKRWGLRLCQRGGANAKKRALVAVARKLGVLLHRLWVTQERWQPFPGRAENTPQ